MIPQVQVGAQPPWGTGSERARGSSTHTRRHTRMCVHTHRRDELLLGTQLGRVCTRRDRTSRTERGAEPHAAPQGHTGFQPLHSCPGAQELCWVSSQQDSPSLAHSWVTARSMTLESLYHGFAPQEQSSLCACSSDTKLSLGTAASPDGWSRAGRTVLGPSCTTPGIRLNLQTQQVTQAACPWAGEGAGISSSELAACARRGRRKQAPADGEAGMRQ